jgi:hypothetical protein
MEPHMIENELFSYLFVIGLNHVGFIKGFSIF